MEDPWSLKRKRLLGLLLANDIEETMDVILASGAFQSGIITSEGYELHHTVDSIP